MKEEQEVQVTEETAQDESKLILSRPTSIDGVMITEIKLDFDSLDGNDILAVERQYNTANAKTKVFDPVKETSKNYLAFVVAKAAKLPVEAVYQLSAKDFSKATLMAQNFLLG